MKPTFQKTTDKDVNRSRHVWVKHNGAYKCVICGGLSSRPGDEVDCDRYERLTPEERASCPDRNQPVSGRY